MRVDRPQFSLAICQDLHQGICVPTASDILILRTYNRASLFANLVSIRRCSREGPMETTSFFRRQAAFCLRLSDFCSDELIANHLRSQAADYHQRALWAEYNLRDDADADDALPAARMLRH